jgi:hypothetical protein
MGREQPMEHPMKILMKACLFSALLVLPGAAYAQTATAPQPDTAAKAAGAMAMNCPMMADMGAMQKDLATMMGNVDGMMKDTKDPAMQARLQTMHDRMAAMTVNMQKMGGMMGGGMMGGGMIQGAQPSGNAAPATPDAAPASPPASSAAPEDPADHAAHHPGQ